MELRYFVRIEVPTLTEDGGDGRGAYGTTGTGYPVANELILTARHVVRPKQRDPRYPIRVRWVYFPDLGKAGSVELDADDGQAICFIGEADEEDIALLRCPLQPPGLRLPLWPWMRLPSNGADYKSIGYPAATLLEAPITGASDPRQNAFAGTIRRVADPWFELTDPNAPLTDDDWLGASGMPIFVHGRIAGVFSAALSRVHGKGHAVPIAPLLRCAAFAGLFADQASLKRWQERRQAVVVEVTQLLRLAELLRRQIRKRFQVQEDAPEILADRLMRAATGDIAAADEVASDPFQAFSERIAAIYQDLQPGGAANLAPRERREAIEALLAIMLRVAPLSYDRDYAATVYASTKGADLVELPAALFSVAELMLAAAERRCAYFQPRKDPNDGDARGLGCLSIDAPELGINATEADYCDRVQVHLGRKEFTAEAFDRERFLKDCDRFLAHLYPKSRPRRGGSEAERLVDQRRGINQTLHRYRAGTGDILRLYTVFRPENPEEAREMRVVADELRGRYTNLRIVFLTAFCEAPPDTNPWDDEFEKVSRFVEVLPVRKRAEALAVHPSVTEQVQE